PVAQTRSAEQVFRRLSDLPVAVCEGGVEGGVDIGAVEGGQGEDGAAAYGGLVAAGGEESGETGGGGGGGQGRARPAPRPAGRATVLSAKPAPALTAAAASSPRAQAAASITVTSSSARRGSSGRAGAPRLGARSAARRRTAGAGSARAARHAVVARPCSPARA